MFPVENSIVKFQVFLLSQNAARYFYRPNRNVLHPKILATRLCLDHKVLLIAVSSSALFEALHGLGVLQATDRLIAGYDGVVAQKKLKLKLMSFKHGP
jgi:hypothetical protein